MADSSSGFSGGDVNVSLQVLPRAEGMDIYDLVDRAIGVIQASGVPYEVGPMETVMEGPYDQLMTIAKEAMEAVMAAGSDRIVALIKVDWKRGGVTAEEKIGKYRAGFRADA